MFAAVGLRQEYGDNAAFCCCENSNWDSIIRNKLRYCIKMIFFFLNWLTKGSEVNKYVKTLNIQQK